MTLSSELTEEQLFDQLIASIVHSAWMAMGRMKDPQTGRSSKDLHQAAISIDMLDMLYKRLDKNMTVEEDTYVSSLLGELKDAFSAESQEKSQNTDPKLT
ncbi:MAG: DUF1844 domain-containing protein [FCB group bacterium]|nr:DUF1844 domain-containing protein [FCB group bacterium]